MKGTERAANESRPSDAPPAHESLGERPDPSIEAIVALAARLCDAERAAIIAADTGATWCEHVVVQRDAVLHDSHARAVASAELTTENGRTFGTLAVFGSARELTAEQHAGLQTLAASVVTRLELARERAASEGT